MGEREKTRTSLHGHSSYFYRNWRSHCSGSTLSCSCHNLLRITFLNSHSKNEKQGVVFSLKKEEIFGSS